MSDKEQETADDWEDVPSMDIDRTWVDRRGTMWRMGETVPITVTQQHDPARQLLRDGITTIPVVHKVGCYICEDPEFAQMGLLLCRKCPACGGHIAADDSVCDDCGLDDSLFWQAENVADMIKCFSTGHPDYERKTPALDQLLAAERAFLNREVGCE